MRILVTILLIAASFTASAADTLKSAYSDNIRKAEIFLDADGGKYAAKCAKKYVRKAEKSVGGKTAQTIALRCEIKAKRKERWQ